PSSRNPMKKSPSGTFPRPASMPPGFPSDPPPPLAAEIDAGPSSVPSRSRSGQHALALGQAPSVSSIPLGVDPHRSSAPAPRIPTPAPASAELGRLRKRLRGPLLLVAIAVGISVIDLMVTRATGQLLMVGPVRPFWIAGPLAIQN